MSFWSNIFGSTKTVEKVVDSTVRGIDALVFTEEEKANMKAKYSSWYLEYLKATNPQNVARRMIAMTVAILWAVLVLLVAIIWKFDTAWSGFMFGVLKDIVNEPFMIIMAFYFVAHAVRAWQEKKEKD